MKTQIQLEAMSDIELCIELFKYEEMSKKGWEIDEDDYGCLTIRYKKSQHYKRYDPTGTPNDIMPLVIKHRVSLIWSGVDWIATPNIEPNNQDVVDDSPLRALTIVIILLLQGEENERN